MRDPESLPDEFIIIGATNKAWDHLKSLGISEQTLQVAVKMNGFSITTMEKVLEAATGQYKPFDQWEGMWRDPNTGAGNIPFLVADRYWEDRIERNRK